MGLDTLEEMKDRALLLEERNCAWREEGVSFSEKKEGFSKSLATGSAQVIEKGGPEGPALKIVGEGSR